jgi:hypothetical protein
MTDIRKDLLLEQGRLVLALILSHAGLFVVAWLLLRLVKSLGGTASILVGDIDRLAHDVHQMKTFPAPPKRKIGFDL